ncbi:hypothetical protein [Sphingomonas lacusdianchii]|uniref:hypothetical protein n=1 Tax=Sphingomonas lacusdianchii TaxID=2917992 RepID=UPI001F582E76|nr:hypothetical protein [Sphingomonas sp. JXJ CY 53]
MNECLKLGSDENGANDRLWVDLRDAYSGFGPWRISDTIKSAFNEQLPLPSIGSVLVTTEGFGLRCKRESSLA